MLKAILPANVSVAATRADIPDAALLPGEEAWVSQAVERRRREFATGRACARAALEPLGFARQAIPALPGGAPRWPTGVVGSVTHCDGYRGCAVARAEDLLAIGIDAEPNEPLPDDLLLDVAVPSERAWVGDLLSRAPRVRWDRLLFSMKEAVYKAWHPLTGRTLDFDQAVISVDPAAGSFTARLLVRGPHVDGDRLTGFSGSWIADDGIVLAAIVLPASRPSSGRGTAG